jgi:hypothetical protein
LRTNHLTHERSGRKPKLATLFVYDGRQYLGSVKANGATFTAVRVDGEIIGTFPNLNEAMAAFATEAAP